MITRLPKKASGPRPRHKNLVVLDSLDRHPLHKTIHQFQWRLYENGLYDRLTKA